MFLKPSKRLWAHAAVFSIPTAIVTSLGTSYTFRGTCGTGSKLTAALFLILTCVYLALFILLMQIGQTKRAHSCTEGQTAQKPKRLFLRVYPLLLLAWLPYYLASFPGLYVYDAIPQTTRAISMGIVDTWHPLLHTYWMCGCMMLGKAIIGSYQAGFAVYTTTQYLLFAAFLSYFACKMFEASGSFLVYKLCSAFFSLFPLFPIMAVSSTKDTVFSASFAVFSLLLFTLAKKRKLNAFDTGMVFLSAFLLSCFRNNGYYALILTVASILVLRLLKQVSWKRWIVLLFVCGIAAVLIPKAISQRSSNAAEVLGVPIQQVCRAATLHASELSKDETNELNRVIPAWRNYYPSISDTVKFSKGTGEAVSSNLGAFISLWFKYLTKYPEAYVDATFGMVNCWINPISSVATWDINHPYLEFDSYVIFDSSTLVRHWPTHDDFMSYDISNVIQIDRMSILPWFAKQMRKMCYNPFWYAIRPLRVLTSTGLLTQIAFYNIVASFYRKKKINAPVLVFDAAYFFTCLLGPVYLIRYALPFYVIAPLNLLMLIEINFGKEARLTGESISETDRLPLHTASKLPCKEFMVSTIRFHSSAVSSAASLKTKGFLQLRQAHGNTETQAFK